MSLSLGESGFKSHENSLKNAVSSCFRANLPSKLANVGFSSSNLTPPSPPDMGGTPRNPEEPKMFISYDYDHDKEYKNLLLAWDKNKYFDFSFYDMSVDVSVDSDDAAVIKRVISARINQSTYFLCLVGKHTHKSGWVAWEIDKAVELKKKIVAVKIDKANTTPNGLYGVGAKWALSFKFDSIKKAVDEA